MRELHKAFIPVLNDLRNGLVHLRCMNNEEVYWIEGFHMSIRTDKNATRLLEFDRGGTDVPDKFFQIYEEVKAMKPEEIENAFGINILWKP